MRTEKEIRKKLENITETLKRDFHINKSRAVYYDVLKWVLEEE